MKDAGVSVIFFILLLCFTGFSGAPPLFAQNNEGGDEEQAEQQPAGQKEDAGAKGAAAEQAQQGEEVKKSLTPAVPVMEIKRLEPEAPLYSIELRNVQLVDLFRVIAHDYDLNIIVDQNVSGTITASFTNISLEEALDGIAELSNLVVQKKGNIFRVAPNLLTKTFTLKFTEAKKILQKSTAAAAASAGAAAAPAGAPAAGAAAGTGGATTGESTIYDLLSPQGKLLLGEKPNSIIVIDYPTNVKKIEDYLNSVDQKMTSRVFKLKYLKATDVVGQPAAGTSSGSTTTTTTGSSGGG